MAHALRACQARPVPCLLACACSRDQHPCSSSVPPSWRGGISACRRQSEPVGHQSSGWQLMQQLRAAPTSHPPAGGAAASKVLGSWAVWSSSSPSRPYCRVMLCTSDRKSDRACRPADFVACLGRCHQQVHQQAQHTCPRSSSWETTPRTHSTAPGAASTCLARC